jgi:uncharacterized membrane protein YGL010W
MDLSISYSLNILKMYFSFIKAFKSTHRKPVNRLLHCIGAPIYVIGLALIIGYFIKINDRNLFEGLILWSIAVSLFLMGHKIEGNLRAMTLIVLFKYLRLRFAKMNDRIKILLQ